MVASQENSATAEAALGDRYVSEFYGLRPGVLLTLYIERGAWDFAVVSAAVKATISGASIGPARIVCGGANNQLAEERHGRMLEEREILYAPDYAINDSSASVSSIGTLPN